MQQQPSPQSLKATNINTDIQYLHELSKPPLQTPSLKSTRLNNINNLAQLLKLKNSKYSFSQKTKQKNEQWSRKKGNNLHPLLQKIKTIKQQTKNKQLAHKQQSDCYFYLPAISTQNQQIYIEKNFQFGLFNTLQSIMSQDQKKGNLAKRIIQQRKINRDNDMESGLMRMSITNLQIRSTRKKQQYLKITQEVLKTSVSLKTIQWSTIYKTATKQPFWQILTAQISHLSHKPNRNFELCTLAMRSLKIVQNQFNSLLPSRYENILYYLTNNYLGKMRGQYESQGTLGPIWGICYMLYRAGRKQQFYRVIPDEELKKLFEEADTAIAELTPKKIIGVEQTGDLFHDQLIYALKGVSKCSSQALCDPKNLDVTWVFLRNVAIFSQDANSFLSLRRQLYQSYKGPFISQPKIKNLLHLLAYGQIAEIGPNDVMDQDDYLHYLIAIYYSPAYELLAKDKKQIVEKKLTEHLVQYIQQLLLQAKNQYIFYLVVIPHHRIVEQASEIIASSELLETINWSYLEQMLPPTLYQNIVQKTLQKYVTITENYLLIAKKQCQLLGNNQTAITYILQFYIKSVLSMKINIEQLKRAQIFSTDLIQKNQSLKSQYKPVFQFFHQYWKLLQLMQERNQQKIYSFLRSSRHIFISEQLLPSTQSALTKLVQFKGFQCYIYFVRNVVKSSEIALTRMNRIDDLQELQAFTLNALMGLLKMEPYAQFANRESVKDLIRILQEALYKCI